MGGWFKEASRPSQDPLRPNAGRHFAEPQGESQVKSPGKGSGPEASKELVAKAPVTETVIQDAASASMNVGRPVGAEEPIGRAEDLLGTPASGERSPAGVKDYEHTESDDHGEPGETPEIEGPEGMDAQLALFDQSRIRRVYDESKGTWWFSVVDIVQVLTEQPDDLTARKYWNKLKERLSAEGSEAVTNCHQLKMIAADGKQRLTDAATPETLLRLVQSVPSPKAEPLKVWLAKVGHERIQELADPALALDRARKLWQKHGRSEKWIQQRMTGQETRNKLTDYWADHEIKKDEEYAILTNLIHEEWSGVSVKAHKGLKGLRTQNLRDHMTEAELIFTALAELSTRQVAESVEATGMPENEEAARTGGRIARDARLDLESRTGRKVVSGENALKPRKK